MRSRSLHTAYHVAQFADSATIMRICAFWLCDNLGICTFCRLRSVYAFSRCIATCCEIYRSGKQLCDMQIAQQWPRFLQIWTFLCRITTRPADHVATVAQSTDRVVASSPGLRIFRGWKTKAWYKLFAHARHFNYNDVTFIYDNSTDVGISNMSTVHTLLYSYLQG